MTDKTEAQKLADLLATAWQPTAQQAAVELRRLDADNAALRDALGQIHTALVIDGFVQPHHLKAASAALSGTSPARTGDAA